ncbi:NAD(P)/FAD-dependent oxidoreductase [Actinomyces sp. F1_1611]
MSTQRPHVVIIGGGFGGLAAVRGLRRAPVDITLVDDHAANVFQPLLYQVATAALNPGDITWFLRSVRAKQPNVHFRRAAMTGLNPEAKVVSLSDGTELTYDYLVLALGVSANFFGIPGAEEHAIPLYQRAQALRIRDRLFGEMEWAATHPDDLRIVVVGGGATGVETAGALAEMRNLDLPVVYPELDPNRVHITLVEMAPHVLAPFQPKLRRYAANQLTKRGVDLRLNTAVKEVRADGVLLDHETETEFLPANLVIWASGVSAHPQVADWGLTQGRGGRIQTDQHLRALGHRDIFAIGDAAWTEDSPLPQQAQPALQGGKYVARMIRAAVAGQTEPAAFHYVDKGTMATIGRASAIAQITGLPSLRGLPAWLIWVGIHIAQLLGNRNRFATMVNLGQKYLGWRSHNLIVGD